MYNSALQRARLLGTQFFYRFGMCVSSRSHSHSLLNSKSHSHCATHQIRLILVSSVVITSLLFPAIASYYSSQTQYFAGFTLRVLDSFLIEITANILKFNDEDGEPMVTKILDQAGQKGTGKWTAVAALDAGMPGTPHDACSDY